MKGYNDWLRWNVFHLIALQTILHDSSKMETKSFRFTAILYKSVVNNVKVAQEFKETLDPLCFIRSEKRKHGQNFFCRSLRFFDKLKHVFVIGCSLIMSTFTYPSGHEKQKTLFFSFNHSSRSVKPHFCIGDCPCITLSILQISAI